MELIKSAVSDAGVTAELFWFHEKGYFEEFLGRKSGMLQAVEKFIINYNL